MNPYEQVQAINRAVAANIKVHGLEVGDLTLDGSRHAVRDYKYTSVVTIDAEHSSGVVLYRTTVRVETAQVDWR